MKWAGPKFILSQRSAAGEFLIWISILITHPLPPLPTLSGLAFWNHYFPSFNLGCLVIPGFIYNNWSCLQDLFPSSILLSLWLVHLSLFHQRFYGILFYNDGSLTFGWFIRLCLGSILCSIPIGARAL